MKNYYKERENVLDDEEIVNDLRKAADDYENGEILEVRDNLLAIVRSINRFIKNYYIAD